MFTIQKPNNSRLNLAKDLEYTAHTTRALSKLSVLSDRFIVENSHYLASSLGNTFESAKNIEDFTTVNPSRVLDGLASQLIFDSKSGVVVGINAGVSDALGHTDEVEEARAKAAFSHDLAAHFNQAMLEQGLESWDPVPMLGIVNKKALQVNAIQDRNEATFAGIQILKKPSDITYQAKAINIGDCCIVVYQQSSQTLVMLPPTVTADVVTSHKNPRKLFTPPSAQRANDKIIEYKAFEVSAHDIVFLMTDGYWDNMPIAQTTESLIEQKKSKYNEPVDVIKKNEHIDPQFFIQFIARVKKSHAHPTAQHFHADLHAEVMAKQTDLRNSYLALQPIVSSILTERRQDILNLSIALWLKTMSEKEAADVRALLISTQHGDGVAIEESHTVEDFINQYSQISFGDDCALTVICIPDPCVEYVRRCIETRRSDLIKQDPQQLAKAILYLANESKPSGPLYSIAELKTYYKLLGGNELKTVRQLEEAHFSLWLSVQFDKSTIETLQKSLAQVETISPILRTTLDGLLGVLNGLPRDNSTFSQYFGKDMTIEVTLKSLITLITKMVQEDQEYALIGYGKGYELIHHAANLGLYHSVTRLAEITPTSIHAKGEYARTPLHMAVFRLDSVLVTLLISKGAYVNAQTNAEDHLRTGIHILLDRLSAIVTSGNFNKETKLQATTIINSFYADRAFDPQIKNAKGETVSDCLATFNKMLLEKLPVNEINTFIAGLKVDSVQRNITLLI